MSEFNLSNITPDGTAEFRLEVIPGVLIVRPASEANQGYFNALLKRNKPQGGRRLRKAQLGVNAEDIAKNRSEDRELYPKYIVVGMRDVRDTAGQIADDTPENREKLVRAMPNWLFDELRIFCSEPMNFLPEGEDPPPDEEEVEELGES